MNHKGTLTTLDDQKSKLRLTLALPVTRKSVKYVTDAIARILGCATYFAKPYYSWERGQNQNANGLLRQYFPKSMQLDDVRDMEAIDAVDKINSRIRRCLEYKTPYEVFEELTGIAKENFQWLYTYWLEFASLPSA